MRGLVSAAMLFAREQEQMMRLTSRRKKCQNKGHLDGETIQFNGKLQVVCPRCGKELE